MFITSLKRATAVLLLGVIFVAPFANAQVVRGQDDVLKGIPAIARAFAPVAGVEWKDFAKTLAAICAVESNCDPYKLHPVTTKSGQTVQSQYQGLFQMNICQVSKAEGSPPPSNAVNPADCISSTNLKTMLPTMRSAAQSGDQHHKDSMAFVEKAIASKGSGDPRFHPNYGIILGAVKHIQIQKQLETAYPGDAIRQAAGHMVAQFSGVTEGKIKRSQFSAPITGNPQGNPHSEEAAALAANRVSGYTVNGAIESADRRYRPKMTTMVARLNTISGGLTGVPSAVSPFTSPVVGPGPGPQLGMPYNGVSTLMEAGYLTPTGMPTSGSGYGQPTSGSPLDRLKQGLQNLIKGSDSSGSSGNSGTGSSVPPTLEISATPRSVQKGESTTLTWAAVGVKASSCAVYVNTTVIARGESGKKVYQFVSDAESAVEFILRCTNSAGKPVEDREYVTVDTFSGASIDPIGSAFTPTKDTQPQTTVTDNTPRTQDILQAMGSTTRATNTSQGTYNPGFTQPIQQFQQASPVRIVPVENGTTSTDTNDWYVVDFVSGTTGEGNTTFGEPNVSDLGTSFSTSDETAFIQLTSAILNNIQIALTEISRIIFGTSGN